MTEEERQAYQKEKQRQQNKQRLDALKAKRIAEGKKDDQEFTDATPLPNPNPVVSSSLTCTVASSDLASIVDQVACEDFVDVPRFRAVINRV